VASTDALMAHSSIGRAEILGSLLTPAAAREQSPALEDAVEQMALTLGVPVERLVWVEAPLTATVREHDERSASVAVWTVSVFGSPDSGSPQQVWRTVQVELELVDGRWLVSAATADAGPTPAGNEFALQSGWDEFDAVANWDPSRPRGLPRRRGPLMWPWDPIVDAVLAPFQAAAGWAWDTVIGGITDWLAKGFVQLLTFVWQVMDQSSSPQLDSEWFSHSAGSAVPDGG
jgi:hypothetical protein